MIDLFSQFPVVRQLHAETMKVVLNGLKNVFSDFVIPETIISDNGPCYRSQEFKEFCLRYDISHQTGAAFNHQDSSIAERVIQTVVKNQNDMWLALLIIKSTPITGIDKCPAELLCNR